VTRYRAKIAALSDEYAGAAPPRRRAAGFWIRVVAVAIDVAILMTLQAAFGFLVWMLFRPIPSRLSRAAISAFPLVMDSAYFVVLHWLWGQTLGKMAMQVRVVTVEAGPLGFAQSTLRWIGYLASTIPFGIGYALAGVRSDKRALHDLIAGTRVDKLP
jgi:uncharacterized RDD family membrane protein YckC